jgi:hypothetical protein
MSWLVFSSQLSALGGSAVVTAINENGMTAMKIAENRRDAELIEVLRRYFLPQRQPQEERATRNRSNCAEETQSQIVFDARRRTRLLGQARASIFQWRGFVTHQLSP